MSNQRFASVWDAIEDTPEEAENMKLRSVLMTALKNHLTRTEMSQAQAAKLLGVTQPRVSDLMRGKINLFGLDALVNMATAAGLHIEMRVLEAAVIFRRRLHGMSGVGCTACRGYFLRERSMCRTASSNAIESQVSDA
jgi:predicted XRE-type DNA-binding protein